MAREEMESVWVDGRKMAETWWGMEWDRNLERYSDYENRIGRGRSYLRRGFHPSVIHPWAFRWKGCRRGCN